MTWYALAFMAGAIGLSGFVLFIAQSFKSWGREHEEIEQFEKELQAANDRAKIEDDLSKQSPFSKRVRLGNWTVPLVQTDPSNDKGQ